MNAAVDRRIEDSARSGLSTTDMAAADRPRERMLQLGPGSMATPELIAILLRVGGEGESALQAAQRVLMEVHGVTGLGPPTRAACAPSVALERRRWRN
ncbi:MAG: hypothetical protein QF376_04355 [Anaerolineales bacterium]|jgi:hypothetical protein|nr:hypothetical protein [Anaerolineaceae bacterium]MDP7260095.1 hypothetical protein [Anaerolineales bacterium]HJO34175.1 UPF0758 domain-containing protein [Anaerolineales bacterium]|tara:strand:- start:585 stop:878 length:294 start_codon:yes stop_codon:yes gene_type:complete